MNEHPLPLTMFTEEDEAFLAAVNKFAESKLKPKINDQDRNMVFGKVVIDACFEMGLMGIMIPEEYGGLGGTFFQAVLAIEEIARVDPSVAVLVDVQTTLVENLLLRWASDEQKKALFPRMANDTVGAYCLSESSSGSDAFALACEAKEEGDDYILNGHKLWVTSAHEAGLFIVFATVNKELGYKGITCFIVERDQAGFSVGKNDDKLGIRASSTCELVLDSVRVPKKMVVGEVGKGYKVAIEALNEGRIGIAAQMVGLAAGALEEALRFTVEREQFGAPICANQGVQFQLAEMATLVRAARLLVYDAARRREHGEPFLSDAAYAKLFASRTAERVASEAVNLLGANGFIHDYPVAKLYRDAKIGQIYEGTTNMQLQTIARQLLAGDRP